MIFKQYEKLTGHICRNSSKKNLGGFTIVESMVAISILLIAVVGPMSIIGGSLSQISTARDQIIAVNLAQEGIEAAREKRDSNMLDQWTNGIVSSTYWRTGLQNNSEYIVSSPTLYVCSGVCTSTSKEIYQTTSTGVYYQSLAGMISGDIMTKFSREVFIEDVSGDNEIRITSTVTWLAQGMLKKVEVKESLFGLSS